MFKKNFDKRINNYLLLSLIAIMAVGLVGCQTKIKNPLQAKYNYCLESVKYNGQKYYDELIDKYKHLNIKDDDYEQKLTVCEQFQVNMPVISSIKNVGPMNTIVSQYHFTYLLDNGKVLIANFGEKGTIEIFNPLTNTFKLLLKDGLTTHGENEKHYYKAFIKLPDDNIQICNYKYDIKKQKLVPSFDVYQKVNTEGLHLKRDNDSINYYDNVDEIFNNGSFLYSYNCQYVKSRKVCEDLVLQDPINKITYKPAKLKEPRDRFKAVLLSDNNILIIGGEIYNETKLKYIPSSLVELYNPITGTTEVIGNMSNPRKKPDTVVLKNGNVIIISSYQFDVYNPKTKQLKTLVDIDKIDNEKQLYQDISVSNKLIEQIGFLGFLQVLNIKNVYYLPAINKIYLRLLYYGILFDPDKLEAYPVANKTLQLFDYVMTPLKSGQILITGGGFNQNAINYSRNYSDRAYIITFKNL